LPISSFAAMPVLGLKEQKSSPLWGGNDDASGASATWDNIDRKHGRMLGQKEQQSQGLWAKPAAGAGCKLGQNEQAASVASSMGQSAVKQREAGGSRTGSVYSTSSAAQRRPQTSRVEGSKASISGVSVRSSKSGTMSTRDTDPGHRYDPPARSGTKSDMGGSQAASQTSTSVGKSAAADHVKAPQFKDIADTERKMKSGFHRTRFGGRFPQLKDDDSNYMFEGGALNNRDAGKVGPAPMSETGFGAPRVALLSPPAAPSRPPGVDPRPLRNTGFTRTHTGGLYPHNPPERVFAAKPQTRDDEKHFIIE